MAVRGRDARASRRPLPKAWSGHNNQTDCREIAFLGVCFGGQHLDIANVAQIVN